jgi:hypothetical protein
MTALRASGGNILYGSLGLRAMLGRFIVAVGIKRALLTSLNEAAEQQGSEGRERFRLALSLGGSVPL